MSRSNASEGSGATFAFLKRRRAIAMAAAAAAAACFGTHSEAQYYTQSSTVTLIEPNSTSYPGATRVAVEGDNAGSTYSSFDVMDFSMAGLDLPSGTNVTLVNGLSSDTMTLDLIDRAALDSFAVAGTVNFYLATSQASLSGASFLGYSNSGGVGTQLGTLYSMGSIAYTPGTVGGRDDTIMLTFSTSQASYVLNQIENSGILRIIATPSSASVAADWEGTTGSPYAPPQLTVNVTTTTTAATDAFIQVGTSTGSVSKVYNVPTINRLYAGSGSVATGLVITNSGTGSGLLGTIITGSGATIAYSTNTVSGGGSISATANFVNPFTAGSISVYNPGTVAIAIHDRSDPVGDSNDATVNITVNESVKARFVDAVGNDNSYNAIDFGSVLVGATVTNTVTLQCDNTGVPNLGSNTLTMITLPGTYTISGTNANFSQGTNNKGIMAMAADPSGTNGTVNFINGTETETRTLTFTPLLAGNYYNAVAGKPGDGDIGFDQVAYSYATNETAIGLPASPSKGDIYATGMFYQAASVTASITGTNTLTNILTLANASATTNTYGSGTNAMNIGLRSLAQITTTNQAGQSGFVVTGFPTDGTGTVAAGSSLTASASFTPIANPLNGTYTGSFSVIMQNNQTIQGAASNDLGTKSFNLSANVTGYSGTGSANILSGGNYGGYYINSGSGSNTTISFIGGTASTTTNLTVSSWTNSGAAAVSDRATVTGTGSDVYVVQMNYSPGVTTNSITSLALGYNNGSQLVSPYTSAGTNISRVESVGAYGGTAVLGSFGINTNTSTVWAVVNQPGQYAVVARTLGDANFDGTVDIGDLNIVLSNFFSGNPVTWSQGDFNADGVVDISDLDNVLSNFFNSAPPSVRAAAAAARASTASTAKTLTGTVSPADTVSPPPANGVLELVVNTTSGDVELEGNNADIASLQITSASSGIITANWTDLHANGYTNWSDTAKKKTGIGEYDNQFTATGDYAVLGVVDYGDIYNTSVNAEDYVFKYGSVESNDTTVDTDTGSVIYVSGVPEPTTLSLMGLAVAGLKGRRRKIARS